MTSLTSNALIFPASSSQEPLLVTDVALIDKLRAIAAWAQSSETNTLPSKEELIDLLQASKSDELTRVRSSAPSPASQRAMSQPPSAKSIRHNEQNPSPRVVSNQSTTASPRNSEGAAAAPHSQMERPAGVHESEMSCAKALGDVLGYASASEDASEVDPNEALPSTPTQKPAQRASESRAWSVFTTVKNVVSSPFKFLGITTAAGATATTNSKETEFTFAHPHKPQYPLTTPTRSSRQRVNPQSERRASATMQRRVSKSPRVPQSERQRRHVDRSTPLHLRGAPTASDMQHLYDEQAATRQRQREVETANLEQDEPSHGKTFRVPDSPLSSDSDDDENDDEQEEEEEEEVNPGPKPVYQFLNYKRPVIPQPEPQPERKQDQSNGRVRPESDWSEFNAAMRAGVIDLSLVKHAPPDPNEPYVPPKFLVEAAERRLREKAAAEAAAATNDAPTSTTPGRTFTVPDDSDSDSDDSDDETSSKNTHMSPRTERELTSPF